MAHPSFEQISEERLRWLKNASEADEKQTFTKMGLYFSQMQERQAQRLAERKRELESLAEQDPVAARRLESDRTLEISQAAHYFNYHVEGLILQVKTVGVPLFDPPRIEACTGSTLQAAGGRNQENQAKTQATTSVSKKRPSSFSMTRASKKAKISHDTSQTENETLSLDKSKVANTSIDDQVHFKTPAVNTAFEAPMDSRPDVSDSKARGKGRKTRNLKMASANAQTLSPSPRVTRKVHPGLRLKWKQSDPTITGRPGPSRKKIVPAAKHRQSVLQFTDRRWVERSEMNSAEIKPQVWPFPYRVPRDGQPIDLEYLQQGSADLGIFVLGCPNDKCSGLINAADPFVDNYAAYHLTNCGQPFDNEPDIVRRYGYLVHDTWVESNGVVTVKWLDQYLIKRQADCEEEYMRDPWW